MKKLILIFTLIFGLFFCMSSKAQTKDYFVGKWSVLIAGTPNGDSKTMLILERKEGKLTGVMQDSTGKEIAKLSSVEEKEKNITANFSTQGYDVYLDLSPVDDNNVKGNMMGMFDVKGVRVKETLSPKN
jgi:hypothetical protein